MCKCTPSLRTPFCGKFGCEPPKPAGARAEPQMSEDTKLPELPPIPEGERFTNQLLFRRLGVGGGIPLYECWADAVHAYARECARQAAEAERAACIQFLMKLHDLEVSHNHFHWAANQLRERGTK